MDSSQMTQETDEVSEVEKDLLNNIVSALRGKPDTKRNSSNEKFCVTQTLAPTDIKVSVKDVGELSFPLSQMYVQKLINFSTSAKFGKGEKTVLDKNVRNTQMIPSKSLDVTINQESLSRITSKIQESLNLSSNSILTPHLHNMLIYGPGQFFRKHRDSEKLQNMVATLVIVLPSPHIGGDLIIEHANEEHIFSTENINEENAKCVCFYSDCLHKVTTVEMGYRVALTFNVVLETGELTDSACTNEELKSAIQNYFNNTIVNDRVKKVIFYLNHTYSEHSLRWNLLKGEDCLYASRFLSVARELALDIHLALAKIHQNWVCDHDNVPEPDTLFQTDSTLNYWVDTNNMKLPYGKYSTKRSEICVARETHFETFDPIKEELEATGNEGSTADYWYRRAAIVLWLKSDSMMIQFELNYNAAITELHNLISVLGNEKNVIEIIDKAIKLSNANCPKQDDFETFANVALYVWAEKEAQAILSPFCVNVLIPENAKMLALLQQKFGINWLIELLDVWQQKKGNYRYFLDSSRASEVINLFVCEFLKSGGDQLVIEPLLNAEANTFLEKCTNWSTFFHFSKADKKRFRELFKACATIGNNALLKKLIQCLTEQPELYPKNELIKLYHKLQNTSSPENLENFESLRAYLAQIIKQELSSQTRAVNDWSLSDDISCNCKHCMVLTCFLRSRTNRIKSWSARGDIRCHIMDTIESSELPIDVSLSCKKRPFTMKLVKRPTVHVEAARKCTEIKAVLQTLQPKTIAEKRQSAVENDDNKRQKF